MAVHRRGKTDAPSVPPNRDSAEGSEIDGISEVTWENYCSIYPADLKIPPDAFYCLCDKKSMSPEDTLVHIIGHRVRGDSEHSDTPQQVERVKRAIAAKGVK